MSRNTTVFTGIADYYDGYTYLDVASPSGSSELVIGQQTVTDLALNAINVGWSEGLGDLVVNTVEFATQHTSLFGPDESTWELRIRQTGAYAMCYSTCQNVVLNAIAKVIPVYQYPNWPK